MYNFVDWEWTQPISLNRVWFLRILCFRLQSAPEISNVKKRYFVDFIQSNTTVGIADSWMEDEI
jgi:hypothetical protein